MKLEDFLAAGLYDPASPQAADRLALLEWLDARGVTLEQMTERGNKSLSGLAGDLALRPGRRVSAREVATEMGMSVEDVLSLSLAAGLPPREADDPAYSENDVALFRIFTVAAALFGADPTRRFTRVLGSSLSRLAEAAVTLFQVSVEQPMIESGGSELEIAKQNLRAVESLEGVRVLLDSLFGSHLETAIRRLREARASRSTDDVVFSVGFVDLVGFTTLTQRMAARDLADVVARFEDTACGRQRAASGQDRGHTLGGAAAA